MLEVFGTRGNELTLLLEPISMLNDCESVAGENSRLVCFLILLCFSDSRFFCFLESAFESLLEFVPVVRVSDVLAAATTLTFSSGCEFDDENLTERTAWGPERGIMLKIETDVYLSGNILLLVQNMVDKL